MNINFKIVSVTNSQCLTVIQIPTLQEVAGYFHDVLKSSTSKESISLNGRKAFSGLEPNISMPRVPETSDSDVGFKMYQSFKYWTVVFSTKTPQLDDSSLLKLINDVLKQISNSDLNINNFLTSLKSIDGTFKDIFIQRFESILTSPTENDLTINSRYFQSTPVRAHVEAADGPSEAGSSNGSMADALVPVQQGSGSHPSGGGQDLTGAANVAHVDPTAAAASSACTREAVPSSESLAPVQQGSGSHPSGGGQDLTGAANVAHVDPTAAAAASSACTREAVPSSESLAPVQQGSGPHRSGGEQDLPGAANVAHVESADGPSGDELSNGSMADALVPVQQVSGAHRSGGAEVLAVGLDGAHVDVAAADGTNSLSQLDGGLWDSSYDASPTRDPLARVVLDGSEDVPSFLL